MGLLRCLPEKVAAKLACSMVGALSPVPFESKRRGIAPISRKFQSNPSGFLCTSDFMAEGSEFEPSVQLYNA